MRRDHDSYPWTWEPPALCLAVGAVAVVLGLHVGRGVAFLADGLGWAWPDRRRLLTSIPSLLRGDAGAGLPGDQAGPSGGVLLAAIVTTELVVLAGLVLLIRWALTVFGPGAIRGCATSAEAGRLLGLARLRRVAAIVRPDLAGTARTRKELQ